MKPCFGEKKNVSINSTPEAAAIEPEMDTFSQAAKM
jgi:hypothetical protein